MRLTWNEIRARAAAFAEDWRDAHYEKGETQSFYNDFFHVFGVPRRTVGSYEYAVRKLDGNRGFIDLFWPGTLLVEQKSAGRSLEDARAQAMDYVAALKPAEHPRYVLACDFQTFELHDLSERETTRFTLADLPDHVERFGFILGIQKRSFRDQDPVNITAAELVGALHDAIKASGYTGHKLEQFLVRIVFCLFADDTGIFQPKDILWDYLENRTAEDGSDLGPKLAQLFHVLNTPEGERSTTLDEDLARFPYVNGRLFAEYFPPPDFDTAMREALLNACRFDWTPISPAIFGSLFQSVMDQKERRERGAHYTTEQNILKVIEPLFLDDLRAELAHLKSLRRDRRRRLLAFQDKLSKITCFDPACGCGNFLIIAYRELRLLEMEVLRALNPKGQRELDATILSNIDVNQFYGIEYEEFPARIAETALWMMDHIMNNRLSLEFGEVFTRIPLKASPTIVHGDALETDWTGVLAPERCSYVLGNPPFVGAKYQSSFQREQVRRIADLGKSGGTLDYVCAWFIKAGDYAAAAADCAGSGAVVAATTSPRRGEGGAGGHTARGGQIPRIAFVSTNSITQGEQVAQLWPLLFGRGGLEIAFAHRTFPWGSEARGKANVHVVIVGLDRAEARRPEARLYSYPDPKSDPVETRHKAISPYLFDASALNDPHLVIKSASKALAWSVRLLNGSIAADGGNLVFDIETRDQYLEQEPDLVALIRPFVGGRDLLNGSQRYCFWLKDAPLPDLRSSKIIKEVVSRVKDFRLTSPKAATRDKAQYPTRFTEDRQPDQGRYLAIPRTSSVRRDYVPIAYLESEVIAANDLQIVPGASLGDFAVLNSKMHNCWVGVTSGRLKSDLRYSAKYTFNTFPLPKGDLSKLDPLAQAVLDARAAHPGASLADLYDPDLMPADLRRAHGALDRAVDRLYRRAGFDSDRERVEHLFGLYEQMVKPLIARGATKPRRRRRGGDVDRR